MMNLRALFDDPDFVQTVPYTLVKYKALDVILKENEESQDAYLILEGQVQIRTNISNEANNQSSGLARLSKDDFFGELSMFDGEPRSAEVIAMSDCEIAKIDGSRMISFMDRHPEKGYFVLRAIFMNLVKQMRQNNIRIKTVLQFYLNER